MTYQGHRSWAAWNVSLWINSDETLYRRACELANRLGVGEGAKALAEELKGEATPDGARYTATNVRLAMRGFEPDPGLAWCRRRAKRERRNGN